MVKNLKDLSIIPHNFCNKYPHINEEDLNNSRKGKDLIEQGLSIYNKKFSENYFGVSNIQLSLGKFF